MLCIGESSLCSDQEPPLDRWDKLVQGLGFRKKTCSRVLQGALFVSSPFVAYPFRGMPFRVREQEVLHKGGNPSYLGFPIRACPQLDWGSGMTEKETGMIPPNPKDGGYLAYGYERCRRTADKFCESFLQNLIYS